MSLKPNRLRVLRAERRIRQDVIAQRLHVTQALVSQWENGFRQPTGRHRSQLAKLLGVKVADLFEAAS